jgi:hypothetical protein
MVACRQHKAVNTLKKILLVYIKHNGDELPKYSQLLYVFYPPYLEKSLNTLLIGFHKNWVL